jgi:DeoR family fructose operon transcriptional repressor
MIAERRYELILDVLHRQRSATVQQLARELGTSESTVRRDLIELDRQGWLSRVHGGAALKRQSLSAGEPDMDTKQALFLPEKQAIGKCAAGMIRRGDFVFIDAGSTTLQLVNAIAGEAMGAIYVTNGMPHARLLCRRGCTVYVPSGQVLQRTEAIVGVSALSCLNGYNFTKAFLGVNGISPDHGFTTPGIEERELKRAAVQNAGACWFLADESKFDQVCTAQICALSRAGIITNRLPSPAYRSRTTIQEVEAL